MKIEKDERMTDIRMDGRVALITGSGSGLGRAYAFELARRGAKVVVNDLPPAPGSRDGAAETVAELVALGHEAVVAYGSVCEMSAMAEAVEAARGRWGRLDIVVANAGMVRDRSFAKMTLDDFQAVVDVNLTGNFTAAKAGWDLMRDQGYGRIVFTTSAAGLYGNFGQVSYAAAKMGVVGMMNTLNIEGAKYGIRCNTIAPGAATSMTAGLMPEHAVARMTPEKVAPAVAYLCSDEAPDGVILCAVAGGIATARIVETDGIWVEEDPTVELISTRWNEISSQNAERGYGNVVEASARFLDRQAG